MRPDLRMPPFDDVRVRRALNLAVDRAKVERLIGLGAPPTCQILPPNFPGYVPTAVHARTGRGVYGPWTSSRLGAWSRSPGPRG